MARQLIVCCDGTNNNLTGRRRDTNVAQLCELLAPDEQDQLLYYDPGVGNPGELPKATWLERVQGEYERLISLAFGSGIYENIAQAYRFLMHHWLPGDQIFLYGFSRGAFTARSVGGLVTQFGLLRPQMEGLLPTLLHLYFLNRERHRDSYEHIRQQVGELFAAQPAREAPVWFVGVWDTVASVGAPLPMFSRQITASPTIRGKRFHHVRQALALDEHRHPFRPRPYFVEQDHDYAAHQQSIGQLWFAGSHCDVGGGYYNRSAGLSREALLWMVEESAACGLRLRADLLAPGGAPERAAIVQALDRRGGTDRPPAKVVHSETRDNALWALAGLAVRDPAEPRQLWRGPERPVAAPPREHASVAADALHFPGDTAWRRTAGALPWLLAAAVLLFVCWVAAGALLLGPQRLPGTGWWQQFAAAFMQLPQVAAANASFAQWQTAWLLQGAAPTASLPAFHHPGAALMLDLGIIAGYGFLLAHGVSWAFARVARLRRVGMAPPRWLNRLGLAACVAVLGDLAENVFTWLLLATCPTPYLPGWEWLAGGLMSAASLAKWLGLAGSLALLAWGAAAR